MEDEPEMRRDERPRGGEDRPLRATALGPRQTGLRPAFQDPCPESGAAPSRSTSPADRIRTSGLRARPTKP